MSERTAQQVAASGENGAAPPRAYAGRIVPQEEFQFAGPRLGTFAHLSLPCRDLEEAIHFFTAVLGGQLILDRPDFAEVTIGGATIGMSPMGGQLASPVAEYPHCAFYLDADQLVSMKRWLTDFGIPTHDFWTRGGKEALMFFKDPTGNLFELYCQDFPGAEGLQHAGTRGHGAVVDLSSLNYDTWKGWPA